METPCEESGIANPLLGVLGSGAESQAYPATRTQTQDDSQMCCSNDEGGCGGTEAASQELNAAHGDSQRGRGGQPIAEAEAAVSESPAREPACAAAADAQLVAAEGGQLPPGMGMAHDSAAVRSDSTSDKAATSDAKEANACVDAPMGTVATVDDVGYDKRATPPEEESLEDLEDDVELPDVAAKVGSSQQVADEPHRLGRLKHMRQAAPPGSASAPRQHEDTAANKDAADQQVGVCGHVGDGHMEGHAAARHHGLQAKSASHGLVGACAAGFRQASNQEAHLPCISTAR